MRWLLSAWQVRESSASVVLFMALYAGRDSVEFVRSQTPIPDSPLRASPAALNPQPASAGLPPRQALDIFAQVVEGLVALHSMGVVHRDVRRLTTFSSFPPCVLIGAPNPFFSQTVQVKPENVQILEQGPDAGRAVLLDLGFAFVGALPRAGDPPSPDVVRGWELRTMLGTRYAAPPEIWSRSAPYSAAVDVWGAGVVLFWLLYGRPPFSDVGGVAALSSNICEGRLRVPGDVDVPPDLLQLVRDMLTVEAERRPSLGQVLERTRRALEAERVEGVVETPRLQLPPGIGAENGTET